ncbi:hypothetical protein Taqua_01193 [Tepidimonas aquatica]|uniref:Chemotaxis protein CheZ n=2 Tax=Tepidimonas aquatica TaxID=247482 RepID=A0A554WNJ2_9BURK|nr:hypothetical protein Taqua_01193 [Tepidimonas aquatica]
MQAPLTMTDPDGTPTPQRRRWPREEVTVVEPRPPEPQEDEPTVTVRLSAVADLQDSLLAAMNDLKRLEGLLDHATANLLDRLNRAVAAAEALPPEAALGTVAELRESVQMALLELQFHDMSTQLLVHVGKVLRGCAYMLAEQVMEPEEDEVGMVVTHLPQNPNPVTQSEMDAGSIELF